VCGLFARLATAVLGWRACGGAPELQKCRSPFVPGSFLFFSTCGVARRWEDNVGGKTISGKSAETPCLAVPWAVCGLRVFVGACSVAACHVRPTRRLAGQYSPWNASDRVSTREKVEGGGAPFHRCSVKRGWSEEELVNPVRPVHRICDRDQKVVGRFEDR
jgi:hypothetical protein